MLPLVAIGALPAESRIGFVAGGLGLVQQHEVYSASWPLVPNRYSVRCGELFERLPLFSSTASDMTDLQDGRILDMFRASRLVWANANALDSVSSRELLGRQFKFEGLALYSSLGMRRSCP